MSDENLPSPQLFRFCFPQLINLSELELNTYSYNLIIFRDLSEEIKRIEG